MSNRDNWRNKLIYVAGAYSNDDSAIVYNNIMKARDAGIMLWEIGVTAIVPHLNTMFFPSEIGYKEYLKGDFEIIRRCDGIYMVYGYLRSKGAIKELALALKLDMPVFHCSDDVIKHFSKENE